MRTFTCKCGKVSQETKQYMVTTDCCGVGYSKTVVQGNAAPVVVTDENIGTKAKKSKAR